MKLYISRKKKTKKKGRAERKGNMKFHGEHKKAGKVAAL